MDYPVRINESLPIEEVLSLYREAGWFAPDDPAHELNTMLKNSFAVAAAFDGPHIIGFARALSDGVSDAYILDVVVSGKYRKQGIAKKIVTALTAYLSTFGIDWIVCIGVQGTEKLYTGAGGIPLEGHTPFRFQTPE